MNLWLLLYILGMNKPLCCCCAAANGQTRKNRLLDFSAVGPLLVVEELELESD
jgi:hypothetical protein